MNEIEKLNRVLKMLITLSSGIKYTISELCSKYSTSERTIHRYISLFREAGFIVPRPVNGLYYIEKNSPRFKEMSRLLHFSEEEAYILSRAIHSIDDVNVLKTNLVKKLYALYDFDRVAETVVRRENCDNVHQILQAIKGEKQVRLINYQSAHSDNICDRFIEPFEFTTNYISVWGFDSKSLSNKTFKISRISRVEILGKKWEYKNQHKTEPTDVFRLSGKSVGNVKLLLSLRARNLLIEEYPLAEKYIEPISGNQFLFKTSVCGWEGVGRFVMGLCNEIEVLSPVALKRYITEKVKKIVFVK